MPHQIVVRIENIELQHEEVQVHKCFNAGEYCQSYRPSISQTCTLLHMIVHLASGVHTAPQALATS